MAKEMGWDGRAKRLSASTAQSCRREFFSSSQKLDYKDSTAREKMGFKEQLSKFLRIVKRGESLRAASFPFFCTSFLPCALYVELL